MRNFPSLFAVCVALLGVTSMPFCAATVLPNGYRVTPAGIPVALPGDMPVRMIVSPDGSKLLVETAGFHDQGVDVVDLKTNKLTQTVDLHKCWQGMSLSADGQTVYLASGQIYDTAGKNKLLGYKATPDEIATFGRSLASLHWDGSTLANPTNISLGDMDAQNHYVGGLALESDGSILTLNIDHNQIWKLKGNPLALVSAAPVGYRPYAIAISPDGKTVAVSNWGDKTVSLLDAANLGSLGVVPVGSHPNDLVYAKDGRLFVANAGSNSVSVILGGQVVETISTSLTANAPVGSTPDALAISPDNQRLFVANADNNDVAVVDISAPESRVVGFIPTGWYPSALAVSPDNRTLYVGTAKGLNFSANYPAMQSGDQRVASRVGNIPFSYIGDVLSGHVSVVTLPDADDLKTYSKEVLQNTPYTRTTPKIASAGLSVLKQGKIKHVIFIIRENRTYDQVFGDMANGNGDASLAMFGQHVTPNAHSLASHYVLFDNFYCNGEVSEDGHQWCDAAYATDFTEKSWVTSYSGRDEIDADERLTASPAGYIWDNCAKHGLSYFSYGEMAEFKSSPNSPPVFNGESSLKDHCSEAVERVEWGKQHDTERAKVLIDDLHNFQKSGKPWPRFVVMWLGEDHTQGLKPGAFTPSTMVGGNDLALGQIVDAVSHSKIWKDTAIFVIEDDAQNGPDHVDAHRSVALAISPYIKRGVADHTHYTTASFVKTIEMALGLRSMTQFDEGATPLTNAFTTDADFSPYTVKDAQVDLLARNPTKGPGAEASSKLDLSGPDRADPDTLNKILWAAFKPKTPMPAPVRRYLSY